MAKVLLSQMYIKRKTHIKGITEWRKQGNYWLVDDATDDDIDFGTRKPTKEDVEKYYEHILEGKKDGNEC